MNVIFFLVPLSFIFLILAIWAFRFALRSNQFDDLDKAAERIILEDRQARRQDQHQE